MSDPDPYLQPGGPLPFGLDPGLRLLLLRLEAAMAITQDQINAYADQVNTTGSQLRTALDGLAADITALKQRISELDVQVDTTSLDTNLASLQAAADALTTLDVQNPEPPPGP
jgi:hypothetical protein